MAKFSERLTFFQENRKTILYQTKECFSKISKMRVICVILEAKFGSDP